MDFVRVHCDVINETKLSRVPLVPNCDLSFSIFHVQNQSIRGYDWMDQLLSSKSLR